MDKRQLAQKIERDWPPACTVVTTAQLSNAGLSPRLLAAAVKYGLLLHIRHGAYVRSEEWQSKYRSEKDLLRISAHFQATHGHAVYSHISAAWLLRLTVWNAAPDIHVTTRSPVSAMSSVDGVVVHRRAPGACTVQRIQHSGLGLVTVTSLEQTIVDCARTEPFVTAVVIGDSGLYKGADMAAMQELLAEIPGRRGVRGARRVLAALNRGSESAGETRLRLAIAGMDVPQPEYQVQLHAAGNEYRVDGAWLELKLALEFDGKTKYFNYSRTDEVIYEERRRERELMEIGWSFIRFEWKDLGSPEIMRNRILVAIGNARRRAESAR